MAKTIKLEQHEREHLRLLASRADSKGLIFRMAQAAAQEAEELLTSYIQTLGRAHGVSGKGWKIREDLSGFVRPETKTQPEEK